jgi:catechol 2,3-dioxygenase-like lactoylglutathione lyase family enzyme
MAACAEVIGIDHIYLTVSSLERSERFYDQLLVEALGFRKNRFVLAGDPHVQYFNRLFGIVLRPARAAGAHDPYAPGLHHLCLRVDAPADVDRIAAALAAAHVAVTAPKVLPEYAPDYYATYLDDPDGLRLEITNFRAERKERMSSSGSQSRSSWSRPPRPQNG